MSTESSDRNIEAVQRVLGEPVATGLSDRAWRVRTQLLVVSLLAIALVGLKLQVNQDATLFGFSLSGLTDRAVREALSIAVAYLAMHFIWIAWESFAEWRLRLTGTRVAFKTIGKFAAEQADYPDDPRQSTLANWWRDSATKIGNLTQRLEGLSDMVRKQEAIIQEACKSGNPINVANATMPLNGVVSAATQLGKSIDEATKHLGSLRIPASLDRFEKTYRHFLTSQNVRWLVIDVFLPLAVAVGAIVLLFMGSSSPTDDWHGRLI